MQLLGKLWRIQKNIETSNLLQQKEEEIIWCWNQMTIQQSFYSILMHKPMYLGLSILDISKTKMYDFWYDY